MKNKHVIENILGLFTIDNGKIKILLEKKNTDPFNGYWVLPNKVYLKDKTFEQNIEEMVYENINIKDIYLKQSYSYSKRKYNLEVAVTYLGIVDSQTLKLKGDNKIKNENDWFKIDEIPKMG